VSDYALPPGAAGRRRGRGRARSAWASGLVLRSALGRRSLRLSGRLRGLPFSLAASG